MPNRIPIGERQIGVQDAGSFRPVLPEVGDAGSALMQGSRSLLRYAEREGSENAQREAIAAAGTAEIVKVGDRYEASAVPEGAGSIYAEVYAKVIDERLLSQTVKDYERQLAGLQETNFDDPRAFAAQAQGLAEGIVKASEPRIAAALENNLTREFTERFRGLAERKMRRDRSALISGVNSDIEASVEEAALILQTDVPDALARAQIPLANAQANIERLEELGVLNEQGADAEMRKIYAQIGPKAQYAASVDALKDFSPLMTDMSDTDLQRVSLFALGATDGGEIRIQGANGEAVTLDVEKFAELFPSRSVRSIAGRVASSSLNARAAEQRAIEAERRHDESVQLERLSIATAEKTLTAIRNGNHDPALGYTKGEVAGLEAAFAQGGSVFDQMASEEGRLRTLQFISETGFMPEGLAEYIDGQALGGNLGVVTDFVESMRSFNGRGTWTGQMAYEKLSAQTRATLSFDAALRRSGIPESQRLAMVQDARRGRLLNEAETRSAFGKGLQSYNNVRNGQLANALGVSAAAVQANPGLTRDFDDIISYNLQLHGGDTQRASAATAKMITASWGRSKHFVGGIGPRKLIQGWQQNGISTIDFKRAFPAMPEAQGATFQNGRLRLRPVTDNRTGGYGVYWVQAFDNKGRALPSVQLDMDDVMRAASFYARTRKRGEAMDAIDNMELPRFNVGTDANGVVRYIHSDEYRRLLKERSGG